MESSISGIRSDSTSSKGAQSVFLWRFSQFNRTRRGSLEMVMWIGRFSLSLKRWRDAWMDNLPMSALSEEQTRSQYLADVAQENAETELWGETGFGSEHTRKPRKVEYCTSEYPRKSLSIQRQLDNIDVFCRKWFDRSPERDWQVPFLLREWISLLIPCEDERTTFLELFC